MCTHGCAPETVIEEIIAWQCSYSVNNVAKVNVWQLYVSALLLVSDAMQMCGCGLLPAAVDQDRKIYASPSLPASSDGDLGVALCFLFMFKIL